MYYIMSAGPTRPHIAAVPNRFHHARPHDLCLEVCTQGQTCVTNRNCIGDGGVVSWCRCSGWDKMIMWW